ncbi:glycosyltransferase [Leucobacter sp. GX24907]
MPACFEVLDGGDALASLTELQRAELEAAAVYHSLIHPGAAITFRVFVGSISQMPILADARCESGAEATQREPLFTLQVRSTAVGTGVASAYSPEIVRSVRIAHAEATPATTAPVSESLPRRIYRGIERRSLTGLDVAREAVTRRRERAISVRMPRYPEAPGSAEITRVSAGAFVDDGTAAQPPAGSRPAILFGMHWLQSGGAERWAVETIAIAKRLGFLPVVVADQQSVHPWLTRPELDGCVVVITTTELDPPLARALLENFAFRGIVIHHCSWLYRSLPWIKEQRPELPVIDSLHTVMYLGGGYPGYAARFDDFIDMHHAIAPRVIEWLSHEQGVDSEKLVMAPLAGLTVDVQRPFKLRDTAQPFVIAYVGRLSREKRPDVFLALVHRLRRSGLPVRAIMQGDGEMHDVVDGLIARYALGDAIERRGEDVPVSETFAEADLLVITSMVEGLSLTTFEAVAAGIPVLSANVGSQRTIVQSDMLLSRPTREFVREAEERIQKLLSSERVREQAWETQRSRIAEFSRIPGADQFVKELFEQWQE